MTKGLFGRQILRWGEGLFDRTPIVRSIYNAVKQIVDIQIDLFARADAEYYSLIGEVKNRRPCNYLQLP